MAKDDAESFNALQYEVSLINTRVHTTMQEAEDLLPYLTPGDYGYSSPTTGKAVAQVSDPSTTSGEATLSPAQILQDTEDLNLKSSSREKDVPDSSESDSGEDEERYLEADEWMESWKPDWWNTVKKNARKKEF